MPREFLEGNNLSRIAKSAGDYWRLSVTASNFLRPAHNLKVVGSNPAPATNFRPGDSRFRAVFLILAATADVYHEENEGRPES